MWHPSRFLLCTAYSERFELLGGRRRTSYNFNPYRARCTSCVYVYMVYFASRVWIARLSISSTDWCVKSYIFHRRRWSGPWISSGDDEREVLIENYLITVCWCIRKLSTDFINTCFFPHSPECYYRHSLKILYRSHLFFIWSNKLEKYNCVKYCTTYWNCSIKVKFKNE